LPAASREKCQWPRVSEAQPVDRKIKKMVLAREFVATCTEPVEASKQIP